MADLPISALDVQTTLLGTDLFVVVDTTDHSMAVTGTDKQITATNVIAGVKTALVTVPDTRVPFGNPSSNLTTDANFNYATSTLTAPTIKGSTALQVKESGGSDTISIVSPASIPASYTITLPDQVGTSGQVFSTSGLGVVTYTSTASAPTASTIMTRDVNANTQVNVIGGNLATTATAAGTTTLTVASAANQIFTGVTTETVRLPDVTALNMKVGFQWSIVNQSTGSVTVQTNSGMALSPAVVLTQNQTAFCTVVSLSNNDATSWAVTYVGNASGGVTSFSAGTTGFTPSSATTGAVTLAGTLIVGNGGTGLSTLTSGQLLTGNGTGNVTFTAIPTGGLGNVTGPASSTDNAITVWDGTTGKLVKNSTLIVNQSGTGTNAFAIGTTATVATSTDSISFGRAAAASVGTANIALGAGAIASGATGGAISIGQASVAAARNSIAIGFSAQNTSGGSLSSIAIGNLALQALQSTGTATVGIGDAAGQNITTGINNTIVGYQAMDGSAAASSNWVAIGKDAAGNLLTVAADGGVAVGSGALNALTSGAHNTHVGYNGGNTVATSTGSNNVFVGYGITSAATVSDNTIVGNSATAGTVGGVCILGSSATASSTDSISIGRAASATTGTANIAIGQASSATGGTSGAIAIGLSSKSAAQDAIAIGRLAMNASGGSVGSIALGTNALNALASGGTNNIGIGSGAGLLITTGDQNVIIGHNALDGSDVDVTNCVAIGYNAATDAVTTAANGAIAIGTQALHVMTSGAHNTVVGYNGGNTVAITTGSNHTLVGYGITCAATISDNTIVGNAATAVGAGGVCILGSSATASSTDCIAVGRSASANTGIANIAIGQASRAAGVSGGGIAIGLTSRAEVTNGIAIGRLTMNTSGGSNGAIAIGANALQALTSTGTDTIGIGKSAGLLITTGLQSTILGHFALDGAATASSDWVAIGYNAATAAVTAAADGGVAVGSQALNALTSGAHNTALGYNGGSTVATTTGSNNTFVGYGITSAATVSDNTIVGNAATAGSVGGVTIIGSSAQGTSTDSISIGRASQVTTGTGNIGIGAGAFATGSTGAIAIGAGSTATGTSSLAVGNSADAGTFNGATCFGPNAQGGGTGATAVGGSANVSASNGTCLGTDSAASASAATALGYQAVSSAAGAVALGNAVTANVVDSFFMKAGLASTTGTAVMFNASGQIGPLTSSLRFKKNVKNARDLTKGIDKVRVVEYDRKTTGEHEIGLIAEEMKDIYPELVPLDLEGKPYSVDYARLTVILIQEIQNLRKRVAQLEEI